MVTIDDKVSTYISLLKEYNSHTNIYSKSAYDHLDFHIEDSLRLGRHIGEVESILDMGSGSGLPSVILAISKPNTLVTAVESKSRKCRFLSHAKEIIGLENYTVVQDDINAYIRHHNPTPTVVTAKAFAPYDKAMQIFSKFTPQPDSLWIPISNAQHETLSALNLPNTTLHRSDCQQFCYFSFSPVPQ